jgi:hypothetical protein
MPGTYAGRPSHVRGEKSDVSYSRRLGGASFFDQIGDGFRRLRGRVTGKQVEDELNV